MQPSTKAAITKPTPEHSLEDIRAVFEIEKTAEVNHRGEAISPPSVISESATQHGWVCLLCEVRFLQWKAVLAHLKDMAQHDRNARKLGTAATTAARQQAIRRDEAAATVMGIASGRTTDLIHFAHEVMGVEINQAQAEVVDQLVQNPQVSNLELSGRRWGRTQAMRIARAYMEINGL